MPGAENTRQISEPQFLERTPRRCHNAAQATPSGNQQKNPLFLQIQGPGCTCWEATLPSAARDQASALLTSRSSLWKRQPGWHKQTPCFVVVRMLLWEANPRSKPAQIHFLQQWNCPSGKLIVKLLSELFEETRIRKSVVRGKKREEKRQNRREEAFLLRLGKGAK